MKLVLTILFALSLFASVLTVVSFAGAMLETAINNITDETTKRAVQIEWEYAQDIKRDWQALIIITQAMGFTEEQLDELFLTASKL
jgi:prophage DNA circulation protein